MSTAKPEGDLIEVRLLVPRDSLVQQAPAPELISQANVLAHLGIPPRRFLEIVRAPSFTARVLRNGRLRLVRRDELLAHLERVDAIERAGNDNAAPPRVVSLATRLGLEEVRSRSARRG